MASLASQNTALEQAQNSTGNVTLPADYQYRLDDCDVAIARHHLTLAELQRRRTWTNVSANFDTALIVLGGYFGWRNFRIAEQEASFLRAVTGNPLIRRVFTPFPFLSMMCVMFGLFTLPVDVAARSIVYDQIRKQEHAIEHGEVLREALIREGLAAAATAKDVPIK